MRGLRLHLTPFAPDQSGAVSVLYELGGLIVVCDAGGCTGNICGFDEPRWVLGADRGRRSAIFSAGLRDMDAIMGRDDKLVAEVADAVAKMDVSFVAVVGTPVPAVIGTDYRALRRMIERRCNIPTITVDATGTRLYDSGASKAYVALFDRFATESLPVEPGRMGILGANPLDLDLMNPDAILAIEGPQAVCYGLGSTLDDVRRASTAEFNCVVAPSGLAVARLLHERFGTPYVIDASSYFELPTDLGVYEADALVVGQQVAASALCAKLMALGASVTCATWFSTIREEPRASYDDCLYPCRHLSEEDDFARLVAEGDFDLIIADEALRPIVPGYTGHWADWPQFAVSGRLGERL